MTCPPTALLVSTRRFNFVEFRQILSPPALCLTTLRPQFWVNDAQPLQSRSRHLFDLAHWAVKNEGDGEEMPFDLSSLVDLTRLRTEVADSSDVTNHGTRRDGPGAPSVNEDEDYLVDQGFYRLVTYKIDAPPRGSNWFLTSSCSTSSCLISALLISPRET